MREVRCHVVYNETTAQLKADKASADAAGVKAIDAELLNLSSKYLGGLKRLDNEIKRLGTEMTNIEGALASLDANFDALVLKFEENENEKDRVNAINKDKIGAYIQDIQTLNSDLNIVRNIEESDEEFAQRLAGWTVKRINITWRRRRGNQEEESFKNEIKFR